MGIVGDTADTRCLGIETPSEGGDYARFWTDSLGSLDQYLNALQQLQATDTMSPPQEQENTHD
jgi:hypothetical protein